MKLPPVRRPVSARRVSSALADERIRAWSGGRRVRFFGSGTQSLAVALMAARHGLQSDRPEAIIPAYGCPDLVAVCEFAGVRAVLVDTARGRWGYDLAALRSACGARTVAIVAVNLCGTGDQIGAVREIARCHGVPVIQDSAQYLPTAPQPTWHGDYVVLSFGRGKPLNLLGGGALLLPEGSEFSDAAVAPRPRSLRDRMLRMAKTSAAARLAFNSITHPSLYGIAAALPGLGLGQTRYSPLTGIQQDDGLLQRRFAAELPVFQSRSGYSLAPWRECLSEWQRLGVTELRAADSEGEAPGPKLRLPLLAPDRERRDRIVQRLDRAGLGASPFYAVALNRVAGVPSYIADTGPFPNADDLSGRLFTLPTHSAVEPRHVEDADRIVRALLQ